MTGPTMRHRLLILAALGGLACSCSTGVGTREMRGDATDVPARFQVLDAASGARRDVGPGPACANPLVDPRDGTELRLDRSGDGQGDYAVASPARYGLAADELLRVDCRTGAPLGKVSR
jgi:hypothetical protein